MRKHICRVPYYFTRCLLDLISTVNMQRECVRKTSFQQDLHNTLVSMPSNGLLELGLRSPSIARPLDRSLGRSVARSIIARRSLAQSVGRSVARSLVRSVARPIDRALHPRYGRRTQVLVCRRACCMAVEHVL